VLQVLHIEVRRSRVEVQASRIVVQVIVSRHATNAYPSEGLGHL